MIKEKIGEILIYQDSNGKEAVDVTLADETLWLSLNQIASLFTKRQISYFKTFT
jgi:DNA ligase (NAD+)